MRINLARFAVAALALTAAAGDGSQLRGHWSEATRRVVLDNGLTVLMLQRGDLPIVSVQALYRFGSRNERPGLTGSAHYIEHMAFRATEEIGKRDLTNQVLRWGGRWNGYTNYDQTVYGSHTPSEYLEWLIYLERQRMRHVLFDPAEVEVERTSVLSEEYEYRNSPAYLLAEHQLRRIAMVAHPYGSPIMGRLSDLEGVTPAELERFYREHYAPNNLILAIVGRFDPERALALVKKHFDDSAGDGAPTAVRTIEPEQHGERRVAMRGRGSDSYLSVLVHSPAAGDEAFATLLALDGVLAGGKAPGYAQARSGSRLHRALIETGLATAVATDVALTEYPSIYEVRVSAPADADLAAIEARLDQVFTEAASTITTEELAGAVRRIRADLAFDASSNRAIADMLTVYEQLDSYRLLAELPRRLERVDVSDVHAFARARLARDRRSIGTFTPDATVTSSANTPGQSADMPAAKPLPPRPSTKPIPPPRLTVPDLPTPAQRRLPNGVRALALPLPGEFVHLRIRIPAGAVHDPDGREGLALLTARMLTAGSDGRRPLAEMLGDREVRLTQTALQDDSPLANREFIEIGATLYPHALGETLQAIAGAIAAPVFAGDALARARRDLASGAEGLQDDSHWRATRAVFEALYPPTHVYGRPPEGSEQSRGAITIDDVRAFHRRHYRPDAAVIAVAGAIEPEAAFAHVQEAFGGWRVARGAPQPSMPARQADQRKPEGTRRMHIALDQTQASIAVGLPGVSRGSPDFAALSALNYLLGETGYAGRLGEALVDTGIAYAVYASVLADRGAGPILVTTDAVRSREAADLIVKTLEDFARKGVTESELREAKGFLLGRLLFRFESPQAATGALVEAGYFGGGAESRDNATADPLREFARAVRGLSVAELNRAAARYYDPAHAVVVVAGR